MEKKVQDIYGSATYIAQNSVKNINVNNLENQDVFAVNKLNIIKHKIETLPDDDLFYYIFNDKDFEAHMLDVLVRVFKYFWKFKMESIVKQENGYENYYTPSKRLYLSNTALILNDYPVLRQELISFYLIYFQNVIYAFLNEQTNCWNSFNFYNLEDINNFKNDFMKLINQSKLNYCENL